ncbi:MAG: CBS domain-containing protein [Porticoccaceae bacterium]|nr:magnesium transporter [Pseudomonadales bacterium]MCP5171930.1 magnesium transporter [Pseudomonadales bacterium]
MSPRELDVALTFIQQHPDAAARQLELEPQENTAAFIRVLPLNRRSQLVAHMLPSYVARLCAHWPADMTAMLLASFSANQTTAILRCVDSSVRDDLLNELPEKKATMCRLLMSYSEDSVGAWMTADITVLPTDCSVAEALKRFALEEGLVLGDSLLFVDDENRLAGQVRLRDLLRAKGKSSVSSLMKDVPAVLSSRTSLAVASTNEGWQHQDILPVLNRNKQIVGLLRHADLRRSLALFTGASRTVSEDDLLGAVGEAYSGALLALLGLLGSPRPTAKTGQSS